MKTTAVSTGHCFSAGCIGASLGTTLNLASYPRSMEHRLGHKARDQNALKKNAKRVK
jgi:hypothetical protein